MSRLRRPDAPGAILDRIPRELRASAARYDWAEANGIDVIDLMRAEVAVVSRGRFPAPLPRRRRHQA